jgi:hypothetical protein
MFARISNSWELVKASWAVLRSDKELIVFPIVSVIGTIIVIISFAIPMFTAGLFEAMAAERGDDLSIIGYVVSFLFYLVLYTVIFFCNTALVGAAMIRLDGGDPTLGDGFRIAGERFGKILGFALISATVGMILRAISERGGIIGQIVSSIFGVVWSVATFLVVPVLVIEDVGPVDAIKRSTALLKKTWGEQLAGDLGLGAFFGLLYFVIFFVTAILMFALAQVSMTLAFVVVGVAVLLLVILGLISATLGGIYRAAVYRYAMNGTTGGFFDDALVERAFKAKR